MDIHGMLDVFWNKFKAFCDSRFRQTVLKSYPRIPE